MRVDIDEETDFAPVLKLEMNMRAKIDTDVDIVGKYRQGIVDLAKCK